MAEKNSIGSDTGTADVYDYDLSGLNEYLGSNVFTNQDEVYADYSAPGAGFNAKLGVGAAGAQVSYDALKSTISVDATAFGVAAGVSYQSTDSETVVTAGVGTGTIVGAVFAGVSAIAKVNIEVTYNYKTGWSARLTSDAEAEGGLVIGSVTVGVSLTALSTEDLFSNSDSSYGFGSDGSNSEDETSGTSYSGWDSEADNPGSTGYGADNDGNDPRGTGSNWGYNAPSDEGNPGNAPSGNTSTPSYTDPGGDPYSEDRSGGSSSTSTYGGGGADQDSGSSSGGGTASSGSTGTSGGGWDGGLDPDVTGPQPIIFDLDGDGIQITELSQSTMFVDAGGDGLLHRTAWAAAGDGVLFYDPDNTGEITEKRQYVFTEWDPTATSDMEALRAVFDRAIY